MTKRGNGKLNQKTVEQYRIDDIDVRCFPMGSPVGGRGSMVGRTSGKGVP